MIKISVNTISSSAVSLKQGLTLEVRSQVDVLEVEILAYNKFNIINIISIGTSISEGLLGRYKNFCVLTFIQHSIIGINYMLFFFGGEQG